MALNNKPVVQRRAPRVWFNDQWSVVYPFARWVSVQLRKLNYTRWCFVRWVSRLNTTLDRNPTWSFATLGLQSLANTLVLLAIKKDWAARIGLDLSWITENKWTLLGLLAFGPALTGFKKFVKLIEVQDDRIRADIANQVIACISRCNFEVAKEYQNYKSVSQDMREKRIVDTVAAHVALAFSNYAQRGIETLEIVVGRVQSNKLVEIIAIAPAGTQIVPPLSELAQDGSAFAYCIRRRKIVIIADIVLEVDKGKKSLFLVAPSDPDGAKGALICYPVVGHDQSVIYTISVYCSERRSFTLDTKAAYDIILGACATHLIALKEIQR